jgi:hypothetical protein
MNNFFKKGLVNLSLVVALISAAAGLLNAQTPIPAARSQQLLVGELRNHLVGQLGGRLEGVKVAEKFVFQNPDKSSYAEIELVSEAIFMKVDGLVDQISVRVLQGGKTQVYNLVQYSNGKTSELSGGKLVAISGGSSLTCLNQLLGSSTSCGACKTKITNCISQNRTFLDKVRCVMKNFDGSCIACGINLISVVNCLRSNS